MSNGVTSIFSTSIYVFITSCVHLHRVHLTKKAARRPETELVTLYFYFAIFYLNDFLMCSASRKILDPRKPFSFLVRTYSKQL